MNTNFEQLRKQELELRKLLEELDTLPQTPQIELQKQEIQAYIDYITPSILKGFSQKFKSITENFLNELEKEKNPNKNKNPYQPKDHKNNQPYKSQSHPKKSHTR
ncbi:RepA [Helicobacter cetorum]|nr:RepA [Helicobacter cetorum]